MSGVSRRRYPSSERTATLVAVGLATAQGAAADLLASTDPVPPAALPWPAEPGAACHLCRPALGVDPGLTGAERWRALARRALAECCGESPPLPGTPLLVASCNGTAGGFGTEAWRDAFNVASLLDVPWAGAETAVASAACASGLHALFLARRILAAGAKEVVVLAVDILSAPTHANFEALRILAPEARPPWQPTTEGFVLGEAAVALRLCADGDGARLQGPTTSQDLHGNGGLRRALTALAPRDVDLILGQGTGPPDVDRAELEALRQAVPEGVPLTTPLFHFGHTVGSSALLGLALAFLRRSGPIAALDLPIPHAADGRPLLHGPGAGSRHTLVACRALGGACAAMSLGGTADEPHAATADWARPVNPGPIQHSLLRRLAHEAPRHRPPQPPELLVVRLAEPLVPPPRALIGGRLLPSAVLEMTPGRVVLQVARGWGYSGPALCLVGSGDAARDLLTGGTEGVETVEISPGDERIEWRNAAS